MRHISAPFLTLSCEVSPCALSTDNLHAPMWVRKRLHAGDNLAWCDITVSVSAGGFTGTNVLGGVILSPVSYPVTDATTSAAMEEVWDIVRDQQMLDDAHIDLQREIAAHGWEAVVEAPTWPEVRGVVWS